MDLDPEADLFLSGALKILLGFAIVYIITAGVALFYQRVYINEHLDEYKCKTYMMPIIQFFDSTIDPATNFQNCTYGKTKSYFDALSQPLVQTSATVADTVTQAAASVGVLSDGVSHVSVTTSEKVQESNRVLGQQQSIFYYLMLKLKAFFDKVGALLADAYYALQSTMDATNVVLMLPEIVMKIFGFLVFIFALMLVLFIVQFVLIYVFGASLVTFGTSLMAVPFMQPFAITISVSGWWYISAVAIGIYASAVALITIFLGLVVTIYAIIKVKFDEAERSSYCCFAEDTKIRVGVLEFKNIQNVRLGDRIHNAQNVLGILHAFTKEEDFYEIRRTRLQEIPDLVCSAHLIFDSIDQKFTKVKDFYKQTRKRERDESIFVEPCKNNPRTRHGKYCLVTSGHRIQTPHATYSDYQEIEPCSNEMAELASLVLQQRNDLCGNAQQLASTSSSSSSSSSSLSTSSTKLNVLPEYECGEIGLGFSSAIVVGLTNGSFLPISRIKIGDILLGDNEVLGIYTCLALKNKCKFFSPHQILFDDESQQWRKAYSLYKNSANSANSSSCENSSSHLLSTVQEETSREKSANSILTHLVTEKGSFYVKDEEENDNVYNVLDFVHNGTLLTD